MSQDSHGLSQGPLGVCVCGVPSVVDCKAGLILRVDQVLVKLWNHCRPQHTLHNEKDVNSNTKYQIMGLTMA